MSLGQVAKMIPIFSDGTMVTTDTLKRRLLEWRMALVEYDRYWYGDPADREPDDPDGEYKEWVVYRDVWKYSSDIKIYGTQYDQDAMDAQAREWGLTWNGTDYGWGWGPA